MLECSKRRSRAGFGHLVIRSFEFDSSFVIRASNFLRRQAMITLICPRCQQRLSVSDLAPQRLTCPNCLAALINPRWGQAPAPPADQSQAAFPRRVFSVDYQV